MPATTMVDTAQMRRLTEFAADVHELANERPDLERYELVNDLHADLITFTQEEVGDR